MNHIDFIVVLLAGKTTVFFTLRIQLYKHSKQRQVSNSFWQQFDCFRLLLQILWKSFSIFFKNLHEILKKEIVTIHLFWKMFRISTHFGGIRVCACVRVFKCKCDSEMNTNWQTCAPSTPLNNLEYYIYECEMRVDLVAYIFIYNVYSIHFY